MLFFSSNFALAMKHTIFYISLLAVFSTSLLVSCCGNKVDTSNYHPVGDKIMTTWGENIDPENVLPEYPRPTLQRDRWENLNGFWKYAIREKGQAAPEVMDGEILVPFCLESALSGVGKTLPYNHVIWYEREINIPRSWKKPGRRYIVHFGAVDWQCQVFMNGHQIREHKGGYTPFSVDITPYLQSKDNKLTVCVYDPSDNGYQPRGKQVNRPEGIWYTPVSGIWQTVWMEPVNEQYIRDIKFTPDVENSCIQVQVGTSQLNASDYIEINLASGKDIVAKAKVACGEIATLKIDNPHLWSVDDPFLYDVYIAIGRDGLAIDEVKSYTALRSISMAKDSLGLYRMQLNGKNLFQYGPLDQGWWPDGLYTAPSDEALVYDIQMTKNLGFNMIRKHVKVEPERWYYYCDKMGVLVWQDMPSGDMGNKWSQLSYEGGTDRERTVESIKNYYDEWRAIMEFGYNHPCIVVWVPFNEAWGQFRTDMVAKWTKANDPTRLVNPASGGNHVKTGDMLDLHKYPAPAMYLFDPDRVNVLGEYGGIGLPLEGHLWWNNRNWGYIKYAQQLAELIPKGFSAAVYTQTSDVEGEVNGLMTYDRKVVKVNADAVCQINQYVISQLGE